MSIKANKILKKTKVKKFTVDRTDKNASNLKLQQSAYRKKYGENISINALAGKLLETVTL